MLYRKNAQLREVRTMSFSCSMKHKFCVILVAFRMSGGTAMPLGITAGNLGSRNQPVRNDVFYTTKPINKIESRLKLL